MERKLVKVGHSRSNIASYYETIKSYQMSLRYFYDSFLLLCDLVVFSTSNWTLLATYMSEFNCWYSTCMNGRRSGEKMKSTQVSSGRKERKRKSSEIYSTGSNILIICECSIYFFLHLSHFSFLLCMTLNGCLCHLISI